MGEVSSVGEVIELAIGREVQAAEFYMKCAGRVADDAIRILFKRLADEELEHKGRLELEMVKEGFVARTAGRVVDMGRSEYAEEMEIDADAEYKDVVVMAIRKERQAFRFYVQLAGIVSEEPVHEVLVQLAEEEARHLVQFEIEYNRITAPRR